MSATRPVTATAPVAPIERGWPRLRSERLVMLAAAVGVLHHVDHVLRVDHSGWPFRPEVSPFTYSLAAYPVIAAVLVLRRHPRVRVALMALTYVVVQVTHLLVEPPDHQHLTWARGYGTTPSGSHPANLPDVASPLLGVASAGLSVLLSVAILVALAALVHDVRVATHQPGRGVAAVSGQRSGLVAGPP